MITVLFIWALREVRSFVCKANLKELAKPDRTLFSLNLLSLIAIVVSFLTLLLMSLFGSVRLWDEKDRTKCQETLIFNVTYVLSWTITVLRTLLTLVMCVKFSRDRGQSNKVF